MSRLLCIHSTGLSGRQWSALKKEIPEGRYEEIHTPDLLGYGERPWDAGESYDLDKELAPLEALLGSSTDLIGHSCGGLLALKLAARCPEKVKRLVLFDPVAWGVLVSANSPLLQDFEQNEISARRSDDEEWLPRFVDFWGGPGGWEQASEGVKSFMRRVETKIKTEVRTLIHDRTPHTEYEGIQCPVLLIGGQHSPKLEREVVRILSETIPNVKTVWMDTGHMGPIVDYKAFNRLVLDDFLFLAPDDAPTESKD